MKPCIIYTRFSPRRRAAEAESTAIQRAYCEQYAHRLDYRILQYYDETEVSGADEDRPGLWSAIRAVPRGGVLLVYKLDRLARNVYLAESIRRAVLATGGTIEAAVGDVEGDGPEQVMIRQVLASVAEYDRKVIALRTRHAMMHLQAQGRRVGRYAPYGWAIPEGYDPQDRPRDKPNMIPVEREQAAIRRAGELHAEGMNPHAIARALDSEMPEASRAGSWSRKTVLKLVRRIEDAAGGMGGPVAKPRRGIDT